MSSISNASFGSRIQNAKSLVAIVNLYPNFAPVRTEDSVAAMTALINAIDAANNGVINAINAYNTAVKTRKEQFRTDAHSVAKLISPIRNSIKAQYGTTSIEANQIDAIAMRMRSAKPTVIVNANGGDPISISNAELSFGALTLNYANLIQTLTSFVGYTPIAPYLSLTELNAKLNVLTGLNASAATTLFELKGHRNDREMLYQDLKMRVARIKAYTAAMYGNVSQEYKGIKGFSV